MTCNLLGSIGPPMTRLDGNRRLSRVGNGVRRRRSSVRILRTLRLSRCRKNDFSSEVFRCLKTDNAEIFFGGLFGKIDMYTLYRRNILCIYIYIISFCFSSIRIYLNLEIFNWKTGMQDGYSMVRFGKVSQ